jgi:hypothetical protein
MPTRVKYNLLPPGAHTIVPIDHPDKMVDPKTGEYVVVDWKRVDINGIVEVEDLNDPKSRRARGVRQHLDGIGKPGQSGYQAPLARLLEEKPKKTAAPKPAA